MRKLGWIMVVGVLAGGVMSAQASQTKGDGIAPSGITLCCDPGLGSPSAGAGYVLFQPGQQVVRLTIGRASYTDPYQGNDSDIVLVSVIGRAPEIFATAQMNTNNRREHTQAALTIRLNKPAPRLLQVAYVDFGLSGD